MAGQGRKVMPTVGATASRGRLTCNTSYGTLNRLMEGISSYSSFKTYPDRVNFTSYLGHPSGRGFTLNQRPAIYYRPSMDHIDNPQLGLLLSDSFTSQTKQHYQPPIRPDHLGSLPKLINKPRDSGFHQLRSHRKTVTMEDKTEYRRMFVPHRFSPTVSQNHVTVGPRRESGFTEGTDLQPNFTFQEKKSCIVEPLQTHSSVMKNDFVPGSLLQGAEARPNLCSSHFSRETGFTRGAIALLTCPSSLLPSPRTKSTALTVKSIGKKEPTGHLLNTSNNQVFPNTPFHCSHFNTHYNSMFCRDYDYEKLKSGNTCAGIIGAEITSGYSRRDADRFIFRG